VKKATAVAVAFFFFLWSCVATQFSEEGDGSHAIAFFFLLFCYAAV